MKIDLGTIDIPDEIWRRCKLHGYDRSDVRQVIVQNGEESLMSCLDSNMFCNKCGVAASGANGTNLCKHEWYQK